MGVGSNWSGGPGRGKSGGVKIHVYCNYKFLLEIQGAGVGGINQTLEGVPTFGLDPPYAMVIASLILLDDAKSGLCF
jgi:hypothetical protein